MADNRARFFPWATALERDRPSRVTLSRDQIVDAALRVMDEEGLDALSMRRLGQELNSGATSLYWHIRNKDELLDLVLDRVIGDVVPEMPTGAGWRETADATARALRTVLLRHRGVAPVMGERPTFGPNALQALEIMLTPFVAEGFTPENALLASTTLINWASSFVVFEVRDPVGPSASDEDRAAFVAEFQAFVATLPVERYPTTLALLPYGAALSGDQQFDYGLERLLDGIEDYQAGPR
ncbi:MAG TPA: TetR/AcrR family transcriptional regulator C-terminal domain-containing protein [Candidatus Limnocylindrales bacterium]